jgi:hypothetical protein
MASRRTSAPAPTIEPKLPELPDPGPTEGGGEDLQPGLPGSEVPQCDPGTPGYIQGIAERPETEEEHNARLGEAAGTVVDVGYLMGTAPDPRPNWPAMPEEAPESPAPILLTLSHIDPGTTKAHFEVEGATAPVTYDFGDGLTHVPAGTDTAHTYAEAGPYTVSVVDANAAEASIDIEVPPVTPVATPELELVMKPVTDAGP